MQSPEMTSTPSDSPVIRRNRRRGFTLIELMIAIGITMVLFIALIQAFKSIGDSVTTARSTMEMSGQLRSVTHRLREDLKGITVPLLPWTRPSAGHGYFEYYEGLPLQDIRDPNSPASDTVVGDIDDVICYTSRSDNEPFVGRRVRPTDGQVFMLESRIAEVIWWTRFNPAQDDADGDGVWSPGEQRTLHRRVLLVRPDLGTLDFSASGLTLQQFYNSNDISVRATATPGIFQTNSLGNLTMRENRFAHNRTAFPFPLDPVLLASLTLSGASEGQDVIASNITAFDVRVYDPIAPIFADNTGAFPLSPGDNAYQTQLAANATPIGRGAFVDLNYAGVAGLSQFSGPAVTAGIGLPQTYCTWSYHYEHDGIDQDGVLGPDQGTNGLDDDGARGVDDIGERETSPPYPRPIRGLKIIIRMLEPDSEQVQQFSVVKEVVPE